MRYNMQFAVSIVSEEFNVVVTNCSVLTKEVSILITGAE